MERRQNQGNGRDTDNARQITGKRLLEQGLSRSIPLRFKHAQNCILLLAPLFEECILMLRSQQAAQWEFCGLPLCQISSKSGDTARLHLYQQTPNSIDLHVAEGSVFAGNLRELVEANSRLRRGCSNDLLRMALAQ